MFGIMTGGLVAAGLGLAAISAIEFWPKQPGVEIKGELVGDAGRGAYLARMSGCIVCHSDFENGGALLAGGKSLDTPYGSFGPPNITPDKKAGIGSWSLNDFAVALRQGLSPEGEPYYPAFPYTFYTKFSDQDVADIWAAIWTVPPINVPAEGNALKPPFNWRSSMKVWQALFFEPGRFQPDPTRDDVWNRGAYIVKGPAHCGACHTPRNLMGARKTSLVLHGSDELPGGGESPPITTEALKSNNWKRADIVWALRTGNMPDGDVFGGSMAEVVRDETQFLTDADLNAIASYLLPDDEPEEMLSQ